MIATKEQELKAVEKIRKIVESLGTDSYVGTAMEGVLEIAEENIQNDFACSMKNRAELAERELKDTSSRLSGKINELQNTIEHLQIEKKGLQAVNTRLLNELEEEEEWKDYGRCPLERYKELSKSALSRFLDDEYCKSSFTAFMVSQRKKLQSYGMYQSVRSTDMARLESQVQK